MKFLIATLLCLLVACTSKETPVQEGADSGTIESAPTTQRKDDSEDKKTPTWVGRLAEASTVTEAIGVISNGPGFEQEDIGSRNSGAEALHVLWLRSHPLQWSDVSVKTNETSFGKIKKNSEKELGKKLCFSGTIIQIEETRTTSFGLLGSNGNLYRFVNYGGSGDLQARDYARMCGVSIGLFDYHNSGGGTGHAVEVAGVWDLPENKKK